MTFIAIYLNYVYIACS